MGEIHEERPELETIEDRFFDEERALAAIARGVRRALWRHKQLGESIVVWKDGRVVEIPPEEIPVDSPD